MFCLVVGFLNPIRCSQSSDHYTIFATVPLHTALSCGKAEHKHNAITSSTTLWEPVTGKWVIRAGKWKDELLFFSPLVLRPSLVCPVVYLLPRFTAVYSIDWLSVCFTCRAAHISTQAERERRRRKREKRVMPAECGGIFKKMCERRLSCSLSLK